MRVFRIAIPASRIDRSRAFYESVLGLDADDTVLVGGVLAAYGIGLLGASTVKLFASGFYAMRDTRTPVIIAASSLIVSAILSWLLMRRFGPAGIALGSSIGGTLNTVLHLRDLDRRIGTVLQRADWRALVLVVAAALLAAGLAVAADYGLGGWRPSRSGYRCAAGRCP